MQEIERVGSVVDKVDALSRCTQSWVVLSALSVESSSLGHSQESAHAHGDGQSWMPQMGEKHTIQQYEIVVPIPGRTQQWLECAVFLTSKVPYPTELLRFVCEL